MAAAAAIGVGVLVAGCRRRPADDYGIPFCPAGVAHDLLAPSALQCWLTASHGRWRTLSHQEAYGALVVQVEAFDLQDADEIARRFVDGRRETMSEISVYVERESKTGSKQIRRVRWTPAGGFETLEFSAPDGP